MLLSEVEYDSLGDIFEKKERELFGKNGFTNVVSEIEAIEKELGIYTLAEFTPQIKDSYQMSFAEKVRKVVATIPKGQTLTYSEVASRAGTPLACRAVGAVLSKNVDPAIPCHRVIRKDGAMGGYNRGGASRKSEILREEGAL